MIASPRNQQGGSLLGETDRFYATCIGLSLPPPRTAGEGAQHRKRRYGQNFGNRDDTAAFAIGDTILPDKLIEHTHDSLVADR